MRLSDFDLCCLDDVEELAHALHTRHHGHFFAAALLDPTGRIMELVVHDELWSDIHDALAWACTITTTDDRITEIVLLSSADDLVEVTDHDQTVFDVTRRGFDDIGVEVVDWVQTDGFDVQSVAEASGHDPWCRFG